MKTELTPKEKKLFSFIEKYQLKNGSSPTVREMREHMGLKSDGFVVHMLKALDEKDFIEKDDTPRGIKLLPAASERLRADFVKLPVLGTIPAGGPVVSEEHIEDWVSFEASAIKNPKDCFILKVRGDSMIDAGIFEGDHVIASSRKEAKPGDIVIALVDGASTVKRYMVSRGRPYLKAENAKYGPIYSEDELIIQGVVIGLMRWY